jgi:hypothetical protein
MYLGQSFKIELICGNKQSGESQLVHNLLSTLNQLSFAVWWMGGIRQLFCARIQSFDMWLMRPSVYLDWLQPIFMNLEILLGMLGVLYLFVCLYELVFFYLSLLSIPETELCLRNICVSLKYVGFVKNVKRSLKEYENPAVHKWLWLSCDVHRCVYYFIWILGGLGLLQQF